MYLQHFGLTQDPLGKRAAQTENTPEALSRQLNWLVETKGVGVITGDPGVGKTRAVRLWSEQLNPMTHQVFYQSDNHFTAFDIYCQLAESLGIEHQSRYSVLWRHLKKELLHLLDDKKVTPIWILDEAHQLASHFLSALPSFLNFSFDTRDVMVIVLIGNASLQATLRRTTHRALQSRMAFHYHWTPLEHFESFQAAVKQAFEAAGCVQQLFSDTGLKKIHMASQGRLRQADRVFTKSLQMACDQKLNHLPDDLIEQAIMEINYPGASPEVSEEAQLLRLWILPLIANIFLHYRPISSFPYRRCVISR